MKPPAVIHVDLDGLVEIARIHGWDVPADRDPIFDTGMRALLDLCDEHDLTATLFVVSDSVDEPNKLALLREARDRGHEIASHTRTHPDLLTLDPSSRDGEIRGSREALETALGVRVRGFRAPGYRMDREIIELLVQSGYSWDSSASPTSTFEDRFGVSAATLSAPCHDLDGTGLLEIPLPDHRPFPFPFNPSYAHVLGLSYFKWGVRRASRRGLPLVLLFHLIDLAAPLPAGTVPGWKGRLFTLSGVDQKRKLARCSRMLETVRRRFEIVTTDELIRRLSRAPDPEAAAT